MIEIPEGTREAFRTKYQQIAGSLSYITTERAELIAALDKLPTEVYRLSPISHGNNISEKELGKFMPHDIRKCVTADMDIIRFFVEKLHRMPPSFSGAGPRADLYFAHDTVNVGIAASGGTAPGVNSVIHWLVYRHCHSYKLVGGKIYGFLNGFKGLAGRSGNNYIELKPDQTRRWVHEPGCRIGQSRYEEQSKQMVDTIERMGINILYILGGNGSLEGTHKIWLEVKRRDLNISVVGIPKTIDNDILWIWHSVGFETAVNEAAKVINTFHANIQSNNRVGIMLLFGAESGFLASNAALASSLGDVVLIPEESFELEKLVEYISRKLLSRNGDPLDPLQSHALIIIAEGVSRTGSIRKLIAKKLRCSEKKLDALTEDVVRSALANVLKHALDKRFGRSDNVPVFLEPRALVHSVPPIATDLIYSQRLAYSAVDNALAGYTDFIPSWWLTEYVLVPLEMSGGKTKHIPTAGLFWAAVRDSTGQPHLYSE